MFMFVRVEDSAIYSMLLMVLRCRQTCLILLGVLLWYLLVTRVVVKDIENRFSVLHNLSFPSVIYGSIGGGFLGAWCNGRTTDFGSVGKGSTPFVPTITNIHETNKGLCS